MVAGYFYRQGDYANSTGEETSEQGVETGLDYKRPISVDALGLFWIPFGCLDPGGCRS